MRYITDHKLNGLNDALAISVLDEPGAGGANHHYQISRVLDDEDAKRVDIIFQHGPIQEAGVNGISGEALLAIVIDRLRCFQAGEYAHPYNEAALVQLEHALGWLQKRTKERLARGVEGTSVK